MLKKAILYGLTALTLLGATLGLSSKIHAQSPQEKIENITTLDVNDDGREDIVARIRTPKSQIAYFLNQGDGFSEAKMWGEQIESPYSILSGDIVGNSKKDLGVIIQDRTASDFQLYVAENQGNGNFGPFKKITLNVPAIDGAVADVTNDGKNDIILLTNDNPGTSGSIIYVLPGLGNGNYGQAIDFAAQDTWAKAITAGDVTNDGQAEVLILSHNQDERNQFVILKYSGSEGGRYGRFEGVVKLPTENEEGYELNLTDVCSSPELLNQEPKLAFLLEKTSPDGKFEKGISQHTTNYAKIITKVLNKKPIPGPSGQDSYSTYKERLPLLIRKIEAYEQIN